MKYHFKLNISIIWKMILLSILISSSAFTFSAQAQGGITNPEQEQNCRPGDGWKWATGTDQPAAATQVKQTLDSIGINADVTAVSYGEIDSCGSFQQQGIDYNLTLLDPSLSAASINDNFTKQVEQAIPAGIDFQPGNIKVQTVQGDVIPLDLSPKPAESITQDVTSQGAAWQQVVTAVSPTSRHTHGMVYDTARNLSVLFGGDDTGYSRLNDTWTYNGTNWAQSTPAHSPPGRANIDQTMVYDSRLSKVILFGGLNGRYLNDTWEYNGSDWIQVYSLYNPAARDAHAMAFDSFQNKTILFGGYGFSSLKNDTWQYDGYSWQQLSPSVSPTARYHHAMAFDTRRRVLVLFGGSNLVSKLSDTWEFDGTTWKQILLPISPSVRENHTMAYDEARGVVVLFGGYGASGPLNDTWEYDGKTWLQVTTTGVNPARGETSMVYNNQTGRMVLFSGGYWGSGLQTTRDTWEYQGSWQVPPANAVTKKVYVIVYNPKFSGGKTMSEYFNWFSYDDLLRRTIDFFKQTSHGNLTYQVAYTTVVNGFPAKTDGYIYTESTYIAAYNRTAPYHTPDQVDYNKIVNSSDFDICGKVNAGLIDEVWIYQAPGFGFWESTLAGPGAYWFNSNPVSGKNTCKKLVPIMGPSMERDLNCSIENFGHRTESTMWRAYGKWNQNSIANNWEKFALVKAKSPSFNYSGCGNVHYPPNGIQDYDYSNSSTAYTNCDDFANYPNLGNPQIVKKPVTCSAWGCDHVEYFRYWFSHLPYTAGCSSDKFSANWWRYFYSPALANNPPTACTPVMVTVSYPSSAAYDGWVLESNETSGKGGSFSNPADTTIRLGDDTLKKQYRGIVSFSTAGLPDTAVITKATLEFKQQSIMGDGDPVSLFQGLVLDIKKGYFGSSAALQVSDFEAAGTKTAGPFTPAPANGWYSVALPTAAFSAINKVSSTQNGLTQLRLRFKLDDNNNAVANYLSIFSSKYSNEANRPLLVIEYYVP